MFVIGSELFVFSPLLPMVAADYQISAALAGSCSTIFSFTYMISAPLFGHVSDRVGRRRILIYSLLAFGVANLLTALSANLTCLIAARLFAGAAAAGVSPSVYALAGGAAPPDRRATWLAVVVSGLLMSLALGAPLGGLAGASFGWASVFTVLAVLSWFLVWPNYRVWPNETHTGERACAASDPLDASVLARRLMPMVVWSTGLYGMYTYLGVGLTAFGFSGKQIAQAILVYGCGAIAGVLVGGRAADRLGPKFTAGASLASLCACFLLMRLALNAGMFVHLSLGLSSAVAQLFFPAQQAGLAADFPTRRGSVLAWNNSALFLGISLGSVLGGEAVAVGSFDASLTICAAITLAGYLINRIVVPDATRFQAHDACQRDRGNL